MLNKNVIYVNLDIQFNYNEINRSQFGTDVFKNVDNIGEIGIWEFQAGDVLKF